MSSESTRAARRTWEQGHYEEIAERLRPAAAVVAGRVGRGEGRSAVDLATGTGSVAHLLAAAGWQVSALDAVPRLLAVAAARAEQDGHLITWREGGLDALPFADATFDVATSSFGLIFAADPPQSMAEVHRVLRPGGVLVLSAWPAHDFIAQMTKVIAEVLEAQAWMMGPFGWGDEASLPVLLGDGFTLQASERRTLPFRFSSADDATAWFFQNSPGHRATLELAGSRADEVVAAVGAWMEGLAGADGTLDVAAEFLLVTARRL